jgi:DNA (cytosine-5)-methyltransferase 1
MKPIPVIDIFAGPGGLSEGFAAAQNRDGTAIFRVALSIEKDPTAHRTLRLRALQRRLQGSRWSSDIVRYIRGEVPFESVRAQRDIAKAFVHAEGEARCAELGRSKPAVIDEWIRTARGSHEWVLIGGPPCQAYSLAGRSRRTNDRNFEKDEKHLLYREYLRILAKHEPCIFVMENVKGLLSATHSGSSMFNRIMEDLSAPKHGLRYQIRSFVANDRGLGGLTPSDYIIEAEQFGIPQRRHRVILFGIREGFIDGPNPILAPSLSMHVSRVISDLPRIRSCISENDSPTAWLQVLSATVTLLQRWRSPLRSKVLEQINSVLHSNRLPTSTGACFVDTLQNEIDGALGKWMHDPTLHGVPQHEARSHMASDLQRYLFATCFANVTRVSPKLRDFPSELLPAHRSASSIDVPFEDRFRVQLAWEPSTTIVSHIAKDGHYYIHPDPFQCRTLTVREAARLQTFPDNYFFEGNRTQQYTQVGNAVPPFLAQQLAIIVGQVMH